MNIQQFYSRLSPNGDCLEWAGSVNTGGYGQPRVNGKHVLAHRLVYELENGPIPTGEGYHGAVVMHTCDNRLCCAPAHLALGSHADNMADMAAKRRSNRPGGPKNGRCVLTPKEVEAIKADERGTRTIARDYAVTRSAIQRIKTGKAWACV